MENEIYAGQTRHKIKLIKESIYIRDESCGETCIYKNALDCSITEMKSARKEVRRTGILPMLLEHIDSEDGSIKYVTNQALNVT